MLLFETGSKSHCATVVFAANLPVLLKRKNLSKTPCATVLLLEIGVKTLCVSVVFLEIGAMR